MCIYNNLSKIISYINGSSIFLSNLRPFTTDTSELQTHNIHVVISIMEESKKPQEIFKNLDSSIHHHYFCLNNLKKNDENLLFYSFIKSMLKGLVKGSNIVIHCRDGNTVAPYFLVAFFLYAVIYNLKYVIYDYDFFIPKYRKTWTESFIDFIAMYRENIQYNQTLLDNLALFENNLLYDAYGSVDYRPF